MKKFNFKEFQKTSRYLPDSDDIEARGDSLNDYLKLVNGSGYDRIDFFCSGFIRGIVWAIKKYNIKL